MTIHASVSELIGNTPLVELANYERNHGLKARLVGKVESFNPAGSVKDRIAKVASSTRTRGSSRPRPGTPVSAWRPSRPRAECG